VPYFICPNCKDRSIDTDRRESLTDAQAVACHKCGFGFLFELMDDYYPAPGTGMVVCDRDGRVLATGDGVFELSGYSEGELMGREVMAALGLSGYSEDRNPAKLSLEWGVRRLNEPLVLKTKSGQSKSVNGDFFPAYDDDGGLLVALAPKT
jgi:PAS domain S-box-containing protein